MESQSLQSIAELLRESLRPSRVFKPRLLHNGSQFIAIYGTGDTETVMDITGRGTQRSIVGVAGRGNTPEAAMLDFDQRWYNETNGSKVVIA
jgi:hypothetical protein